MWLQQAHGRRLTAADRRHLAVTAAFLREADRDRIVADAETSINEDAELLRRERDAVPLAETGGGHLRRRHERLRGYARRGGEQARQGRISRPPSPPVSRRSRPASACGALPRGELDSLLQLRIRHHEATRLRALGVTGLAWAGALAIAFYISRSVSRPLAATARQLASTAQQVASTASQVSASALSLARGASEQAASLEETSASLEELASMTRRNADCAAQAATLVTGVSRQVDESNAAFSTMVASMSGIHESSDKVSRIIKTIDEIAFQTNILALNAAVEAARAGEAGMGFAVVADEVRTLAQRSARAAKDTEGLIEASIARTGEGAARVEEVARVISSITGSVSQLEALVGDVREASRQQSEGIAQVSQAIVQMEHVTQTTAATAEETAFASAALNGHAETSMVVVGRLAGLVERARAAVAGRTAKGGITKGKTGARVPNGAAPQPRPARPAQPRSRRSLRRAS